MDSFSEYVFQKHICFMLSTDRQFRMDFVDLLLNFDRVGDPELLHSIICRITIHFMDNVTSRTFHKGGIERQFMQVLNDRKILSFVRVMQLTRNFETDARVDRNTWFRRFQNFAFSDDTGIDLFRISKITLDLPHLKVLDNLNREQKSILEQLTTREIDLLANLTPQEIDMCSMITRLPGPDKLFLLSLKPEEFDLIRDFGLEKIQFLSKLEKLPRNLLLEFDQNDPKKQETVLDWMELNTNAGREALRKLAVISPHEKAALKDFIDEQWERIRDFTTLQAMNEVIQNTGHEIFCLSMKQLGNSIMNLSETGWETLRGLDHRVFSVVRALEETEFDQLLLLPKGVFERIFHHFRKSLRDLVEIIPRGNPLTPRIISLERKEEAALERLDLSQRVAFAKTLNLPPRTIRALLDLDFDRITAVMETFKDSRHSESDLDDNETVILKRIKGLSPEDKHNIAYMIEDEWHAFSAMRNFDNKTLNTLINLSNPGIDVLKAISLLSEEQLNFVRKTSQTGLSVLIKNSQLIPQKINSIMRLENEEERSFLLNLDLKTRFNILNERDRDRALLLLQALTIVHRLTPDGIKLLQEMKILNNDELQWTRLLNYDKKTNYTTTEVELYTYLNRKRTEVFVDLFDSIESDGKSVINMWSLMFDRSIEKGVKHTKLVLEVSKLIQADLMNGSKLLANILITSRLRAKEDLRFVQNSSRLGPVFFMEWLQLSVQDGFDPEYSSNIIREIERRRFEVQDLAETYDYSNPQHIEFFKWILMKSEKEFLHNVAREILIDCLSQDKSVFFYKIFDSNVNIIIEPLRKIFTADDFYLAKALFFNSEDEHSTATWLSRILNSTQCLYLLQSEIRSQNHGVRFLLRKSLNGENVFAIFQVDQMKLLEISIYFDRGDVVPLLNTLTNQTIIAFLETDSGAHYFWSSLSNGRVNLLKFLNQRLDLTYLKNLLSKGNYGMVRRLVSNVRSATHAENLATLLHMLYEIDPNIPEHYYLNMSSKIIMEAQKLAPPEMIVSIVRRLMTPSISQENLIDQIYAINPRDRIVMIPEETPYACSPKIDIPCIDSRDRRRITEEAKDLFRQGIMLDITFHHDLSAYTEPSSTRQRMDPEFEQSFIEKLPKVDLDALNSNIQEIVLSLRENSSDIIAWNRKLTAHGVSDRIKNSTNAASLAFVMSLVSQHGAYRDFQTLGYKALNIWVIPRIGDIILESFPRSTYNPFDMSVAPILNRNLFAFGNIILEQEGGMKFPDWMRQKISELNIIGHYIFIDTDTLALSATIMNRQAFHMLGGPTVLDLSGVTVSVVVFPQEYYRETKWEFDKLEVYIRHAKTNKKRLPCSMVLCNGTIDRISTSDPGNQSVLERYISLVIGEFKGNYDSIGLSLPRWIVGKTEYYIRSTKKKFQFSLPVTYETTCKLETDVTMVKLVFDRRAVVRSSFNEEVDPPNAPLMPKHVGDFHLICAPSASTVEVEKIIQKVSPNFDEKCTLHVGHRQSKVSTERYRLHGNNDDRCQNSVLYKRDQSLNNEKMMLYIAQDYFEWESSQSDSIDVIFFGKDISFIDSNTQVTTWIPTNHYIFNNHLSTCKIHKRGLNVFHTNENEFKCDLNSFANGQVNAVVIQGDFVDSENIHFVYGDRKNNKIGISHARFIDGGSGNDNIVAGNFTIVQGYLGDLIMGGAAVVLPRRIELIEAITIEPSTFIFWHKNGANIEMDKNCKFISEDGYFVIPIQKNRENNRVRSLRIYKISQVNMEFKKELATLELMKNDNFHLIKHVSSPHHDIILTEINHNVFLMDKDSHNYYWEAPIDAKNTYILCQPQGNVTISQMNGILDFGPLNITIHEVALSWNEEEGMQISQGGLRVILLKNYHTVRVTFNGKEYYELKYKDLVREFCSHPFKVEGKISINSFELNHHYNCFDFQTDKVYFVRFDRNLILVSGKGALLLHNYYTSLHKSLDLSLRLNHRTVTPDDFRIRADTPTSIKYYEVDERGLQIYHNQPKNKYQIGVIDLRKWPMAGCHMEMSANTLTMFLPDDISLQVKNWDIFQHAREILFVFGDEIFLNTACIISDCSPKYILEEFQNVQPQSSRPKRGVPFSTTNHSSSKMYTSSFYVGSCIADNFGFLLFILQSFLTKNYPLPAERFTTPEEIFAVACNITQTFEDTLRTTAEQFDITLENVNFFHIYANVINLMREEKYSQIPKTFHSIIESVALGNKTFVDTLKQNIRRMIS